MVTDIMKPVLSGAKSVFGVLYNTFIGLIFSIYLLGYKEKLAGITKKVIYAICKRKTANVIVRISRQCDTKFTTSFTGKILDSIIVGMICFLTMVIFRFPYAVLISVIIGVTNVIPFFGPIIGAAPCALLILFVNPLQCLYFIIMVIILQQLDANVLTPKIVGDTIGLSPIWVLFACVFFGSLWGVAGMLLAVPLMACIYMIIKEVIEYKLYRKGLELDTGYYTKLEYADETEIIRLGYSAELGALNPEANSGGKSPDSEDIKKDKPDDPDRKNDVSEKIEKTEDPDNKATSDTSDTKTDGKDENKDENGNSGSEDEGKGVIANIKNAVSKVISKNNDK